MMASARRCFEMRNAGCLAWSALLAVLLLPGCATRPPLPDAATAAPAALLASLQERAAGLRSWRVRGQVGVRYRGGSWRGSLDWRQDGPRFDMKFSNMLGNVLLTVAGKFGGEATATDSRGESHNADSPEQLVQALLGVGIPVSRLRAWMVGTPVPGVPATGVFADGDKLLAFEQNGWSLRYFAHHPGRALPLPERFELSKGDVTAVVSIRSWTETGPGRDGN